MKRRSLLAAGAATLALPSIGRAQASRTLRFVPQANLASLDAIAGTQYVVRNASLLVWDTLFGVNSDLEPKPQMVEAWENTDGGLTWTFKLRPGLKFHDGAPVLARDVISSLDRWMVRDTMGQRIKALQQEMVAVDDRTVRLKLSKPFPKMLFALGKNNAPVAEIMPERIAKTDPFTLISEFVGSGPMKFKRDEWNPGSLAVFELNRDYQPRSEPASWLSGGKQMHFDRIEWLILPDDATKAAALQNNEIDWWENPVPDLVPLLKRNKNITVDIADPLGNIGSFRMNHLHPPFNDVRVRRAVMMALSQEDYMRAVVGDDTALWKTLPSFFTPGTSAYTEAGGELLKGPRRYDEAKKLLAEAGYDGTPVVLCVATDVQITKAQGDITADLLGKIGMKVDYQAIDWGTLGARRAKKDPPSAGGWNIFHTWHAGADCINPAPYTAFDAGGDKAWFGWPKSDLVQGAIAAWYDAPDAGTEKTAMDNVNRAAMDFVTYLPTGFFLGYQAWRSTVSGVVKAPFPVFWDVKKV